MTYWEYITVADASEISLKLKLNELGQEHWELVSVCFQETGNRFVAFLKKPQVGTSKRAR